MSFTTTDNKTLVTMKSYDMLCKIIRTIAILVDIALNEPNWTAVSVNFKTSKLSELLGDHRSQQKKNESAASAMVNGAGLAIADDGEGPISCPSGLEA